MPAAAGRSTRCTRSGRAASTAELAQCAGRVGRVGQQRPEHQVVDVDPGVERGLLDQVAAAHAEQHQGGHRRSEPPGPASGPPAERHRAEQQHRDDQHREDKGLRLGHGQEHAGGGQQDQGDRDPAVGADVPGGCCHREQHSEEGIASRCGRACCGPLAQRWRRRSSESGRPAARPTGREQVVGAGRGCSTGSGRDGQRRR